jgi:hypothetical protein
MRKHEDKSLEELAANLATWYEKEFEESIPWKEIRFILEEERKRKHEQFLGRRLGHLQGADFIKFVELFNAKKKEK